MAASPGMMIRAPTFSIVLAIGLFLLASSALPARVDHEPDATSPAGLLHGHLPAELTGLVPLARADSAAPLRIQVTLKLRNRPELDHLLEAQQDPDSPLYHHWLNSGEFDARFGPAQADL